MKRRVLLKKIYPYILFFAGCLFMYFICSCRKPAQSISYIPKVQAASLIPAQEDKRINTLKAFFEEKGSPLATASAYFIEAADTYGLDWTLMPAISGIESNFGKRMPYGSNNPFGLGGSGRFMKFPTLYTAIDYTGSLLSTKYKLAANSAIGSIYCPAHECNRKWAVIVTNFSKEILN